MDFLLFLAFECIVLACKLAFYCIKGVFKLIGWGYHRIRYGNDDLIVKGLRYDDPYFNDLVDALN